MNQPGPDQPVRPSLSKDRLANLARMKWSHLETLKALAALDDETAVRMLCLFGTLTCAARQPKGWIIRMNGRTYEARTLRSIYTFVAFAPCSAHHAQDLDRLLSDAVLLAALHRPLDEARLRAMAGKLSPAAIDRLAQVPSPDEHMIALASSLETRGLLHSVPPTHQQPAAPPTWSITPGGVEWASTHVSPLWSEALA